MTRSAAGSMRRLDDGPANKPGRWELRVSVPTDGTGNRRTVSRVHRGSRQSAARALSLLVATTTGKPTAGISLGDCITQRIELIEKDRSPLTIQEYRRLYEVRIKPDQIADMPVDRLTARHVDDFYRRLTDGGVTPAGVKPIHRLIASSLNQGVRWGWIETSPADRASPPVARRAPRKMPKADQVLAALVELVNASPDDGSIIWAAAWTGARRGELCGLHWSDVDLEPGTIRIHRSIAQVGGKLVEKSTKTHGERIVDLDQRTVAVLAARWARACEWAESCDVVLDPEAAYLWSDEPDGTQAWRPDRVSHLWRRWARSHDLDDVRLHDLRHLNASMLLAAGASVASVAERLGHASPAVTTAIYSHALPGAGKTAAALLEGGFYPA